MAQSRQTKPLGLDPGNSALPARTPGPLGIKDHGDPNVISILGNTPGSLGVNDHAQPVSVQPTAPASLLQPAGSGVPAILSPISAVGVSKLASKSDRLIAWGKKVSQEFKDKIIKIAEDIGVDPSYLMAAMAFESGESFSPSKQNAAGSGATGLIQFMPRTAIGLGTSTEKLKKMTAEDQLDYVAKYFKPYKGKLKSLDDVYMVILWPAAVGKSNDYVLFDKDDKNHPKNYIQNAGLDTKIGGKVDGKITKAEAAAKVRAKLAKGLQPPNVG